MRGRFAPTDTSLTSTVNVNETIYAFECAATGQVVTLDVRNGLTTAVSDLDPAAGLIGGATPVIQGKRTDRRMTAVVGRHHRPTKTNVFLRGLVDASPAFPFAALTIKMSVCADFLVPDPAFGAVRPPESPAFTAGANARVGGFGAGRHYRNRHRQRE